MIQDKITVTFLPAGEIVRAAKGSSFSSIAETAGISLRMPCGAKGRCGKCKILFEKGAPAPTSIETRLLSDSELARGYRLGCMTVLSDDAVIRIPGDLRESARILTNGTAKEVNLRPSITKKFAQVPEPSVIDLRSDLERVLDSFGIERTHVQDDLSLLRRLGKDIREAGFAVTGVFAGGEPILFEPGDTTSECYGVALDIGTTTLAAYLLDLKNGEQLSVAAAINPQAQVGDDVISRISYAMDASDGLQKLQALVVSEVNAMVETLAEDAGISSDSIYELTVVGNTCMTHLFLGVDPRYLAQSPYVSTISQSLSLEASELGVKINPFGLVYVLPTIAGYVGADTVSMICATGLHLSDKLVLAVDIGTNGEMVLGSRRRMVACSTAAGPAFEGAHIKHGMHAATGAIDAAWIDDSSIDFSTIGDTPAAGICGSGLLDAIVCLLKAGVIDATGRIVAPGEVPSAFAPLRERLREGDDGREYILATADESSTGGPIVVTQKDVREVQLAKGAIAAGIRTLMDKLEVSVGDLDKVILAGAFGNYISNESAVACGMIPPVAIADIESVGNAAGEGAKMALISTDAREEADRIASSVEYIELTIDPDFQDRFADALMLGCENWA